MDLIKTTTDLPIPQICINKYNNLQSCEVYNNTYIVNMSHKPVSPPKSITELLQKCNEDKNCIGLSFFNDNIIGDFHFTTNHFDFTICHISKISIVGCKYYNSIFIFKIK